MQYLLKVLSGGKPVAEIALQRGENIITPEAQYRYVLLATDSVKSGKAPSGERVIAQRNGDDLIIEGLADGQSLVMSAFFAVCAPAACAIEVGGETGDRFTIDAGMSGPALGGGLSTLYLFDTALQPLRAPSASTLATARASTAGAAESAGLSADSSAVAAPGTGDAAAATVPALAGGPAADDAAAPASGGLGWGAIAGIAGGAVLVGAAAGAGGGGDAAAPSASTPAMTRLLLEGNDLVIDSAEVASDNGIVIYGSANNAQQVEVSVIVPGSAAVNTRVFTVDGESNFGFIFGAGFFTGAPAGSFTVTATPINTATGARGEAVTVTYNYAPTAAADAPEETAAGDASVLTAADLLSVDMSLFTDLNVEISASTLAAPTAQASDVRYTADAGTHANAIADAVPAGSEYWMYPGV